MPLFLKTGWEGETAARLLEAERHELRWVRTFGTILNGLLRDPALSGGGRFSCLIRQLYRPDRFLLFSPFAAGEGDVHIFRGRLLPVPLTRHSILSGFQRRFSCRYSQWDSAKHIARIRYKPRLLRYASFSRCRQSHRRDKSGCRECSQYILFRLSGQ